MIYVTLTKELFIKYRQIYYFIIIRLAKIAMRSAENAVLLA